MARTASPRRFAQAVFQIARENDDFDRWLDDLTLLADAVSDSQFRNFLNAPEFTSVQKAKVIQQTLKNSVDSLALNLLSILAARGEVHLMPDITEQYQRLLDAHRGVAQATVTTAVPISDDHRKKIAELLKDMVGMEVRITTVVDPQILGGLVARVGDKVIDGSTRTRLNSMRSEMVGSRS